jgi:hypothetical protein
MNVAAKLATLRPSVCGYFLEVDHLGVALAILVKLIGNPDLGETETRPVGRCEPQQR